MNKKAYLEFNELISEYEELCNRMLDSFIENYYCDEDNDISTVNFYWVGDEIGGVCYINDHFWDINWIKEVFKTNPTKDQLFGWYNHSQDEYEMGKSPTSLQSYLKIINNI